MPISSSKGRSGAMAFPNHFGKGLQMKQKESLKPTAWEIHNNSFASSSSLKEHRRNSWYLLLSKFPERKKWEIIQQMFWAGLKHF